MSHASGTPFLSQSAAAPAWTSTKSSMPFRLQSEGKRVLPVMIREAKEKSAAARRPSAFAAMFFKSSAAFVLPAPQVAGAVGRIRVQPAGPGRRAGRSRGGAAAEEVVEERDGIRDVERRIVVHVRG